MNSILTPVRRWAARCPEKLLYAFLDRGGRITQSYTYSAFMGRTTDIASHLRRAHPMPRGSRVLLAYSPGLEMICAFFACVRLGLIPVPVCPAGGQGGQATCDRINLIAADCGASGVLTDKCPVRSAGSDALRGGAAARPLQGEGVFGLPWIKSTDADRNVNRDFDEAHSEVLFLQYTSGSTSEELLDRRVGSILADPY